jgi:hypothetical protein
MIFRKKNSVVLSDGLGNQLFQFAFAHYLQSRFGGRIALVANPLAFHESRPLQIGQAIAACGVTYAQSNRLSLVLRQLKDYINVLGRRSPRLAILLSGLAGLQLEKEEYSMPEKLKSGIHIGYFQHSGYTSETSCVLKDIRTGLAIETNLEDRLTIHVRGGDYKNLKEMFGLLSHSYYERSIAQAIERGAPIETIFVVTDDLSFAKEALEHLGYPFTFIGPKDMDSLTAFKFLAQSSHLVIGNSTFSWWAARLSTDLGGLAWKPNPWFLNYKEVRDAFDGRGFNDASSSFNV